MFRIIVCLHFDFYKLVFYPILPQNYLSSYNNNELEAFSFLKLTAVFKIFN